MRCLRSDGILAFFFATFEHGMGVFDGELPHLPGRVYESLSSLLFASYVGLELWDLRSRF